MDLALSEEHRMIRDVARDFAQNEIAPIAAHFDETGEFPFETIMKMGAQGLMGIEVPEEYGGVGMDTLAYVVALEEISKADAAHGTIMSESGTQSFIIAFQSTWPSGLFTSRSARSNAVVMLRSLGFLRIFVSSAPVLS